jgi:tetratricopeptide (TPR) repeat protein
MAFVRKKGNQLALVQGERDPETGCVRQHTLFTIYSKAEALAIVNTRADEFESRLTTQYPHVRFNWKAIRAAIRKELDALPDLYEYKHERVEKRFRQDLTAFAGQLFRADPQELVSAANLLKAHQHELEVLADLIQWRLRLCEQKPTEWNTENPFYWRFSLPGWGAPQDAEEILEGYYERGEYRRAEAGFRLMTEHFDDYAEGYNYLGLIAWHEQRYDNAIEYFRKTIEVGRSLFPKRMPKKNYWRDLKTRPYMRGLQNLAATLNEVGRFDECLDLCDRLDEECGDRHTASWQRAVVSLNLGRWREAMKYAKYIGGIDHDAAFIEAFAACAAGDPRGAFAAFLHAALHRPRAARMLLGLRVPRGPLSSDAARDHNAGVTLTRALHAYLDHPPRSSRTFFSEVLRSPRVAALLEETADVTKRWRDDRKGSDRSAFDRMQVLHSRGFAEAEADRWVEASEVLSGRSAAASRR